jgi:gamma-glutamyltranspeptidase/glutathione hydrolase
LRRGGNAFDAAVAVASTLNVVEPMMSGVGGYGTILVFDAKSKRIRFLDSSGRIPRSVNSDVFRAPYPDYRKNRTGPKAVSTPGNVAAWEALSKTYGSLPWPDLFQSALRISREGFVLDERTARLLEIAFPDFPKLAQDIYGTGGKPIRVGALLVQRDLGHSLELIAKEGAKVVYGGALGIAIDKEMRRSGGFLSLEDLVRHRAEWWDPIHIPYRDWEIFTSSPPANSFDSLIRLGIMAQFDVARLGHNTVPMLHRFIETTKHAFWCRLKYSGDPDINPPPLGTLLSEDYWREQAAKIDPARARPFVYPGSEGSPSKHTTHFVVADSKGNIVCATQTLGNLFGSRIMPPGTGIWLNNSLSYCTFEPKGNPMDAHAGHRKLSGDCPTIILRHGLPWAALGTPGGHTISQTVPQMVMNLIDFRMDIQGAIAAPRLSFDDPDTILIEEGIPEKVRRELAALGHKLRVISPPDGLGDAHGLVIEYNEKGVPVRFCGGSDPRGNGLAQGY